MGDSVPTPNTYKYILTMWTNLQWTDPASRWQARGECAVHAIRRLQGSCSGLMKTSVPDCKVQVGREQLIVCNLRSDEWTLSSVRRLSSCSSWAQSSCFKPLWHAADLPLEKCYGGPSGRSCLNECKDSAASGPVPEFL